MADPIQVGIPGASSEPGGHVGAIYLGGILLGNPHDVPLGEFLASA